MEKEQDLQKTIDVLKKDNVEMGREIISLKRQIGGYKAANERYRKDLEKCKKEAQNEVSRLRTELDNAKAYGKKADELKALRIDTLNGALKASNAKIDELNKELAEKEDALMTAHEQVALVSQNNKDLADEICACKAQIDWYNNLPWYKKFFVMTI